MRRRDQIITKDCVAPRAILEDEIPRDGGLWPEYAHTMFVCVDSFEEGLAEGRIHTFCFQEPLRYSSLDQLLMVLGKCLDDAYLAQADSRPRSLTAKKRAGKKLDFEEWSQAEAPRRREPAYQFHDLRPSRGKLASFYLRVYSRQHASMQGVVAREGSREAPVAFRSALELLYLLRGVLDDAAAGKTEAS